MSGDMFRKMLAKLKALSIRRRFITGAAVVLAIVIILMLVVQSMTPKRSIAGFCKVYKEEKTRLVKLPGNTWPSGVFSDEISDASEFALSFEKLEKVAPDEIAADLKTLQGIYQKIHDDPSQAIAASLSGMSTDESVKKWTVANCKVNP